MKFTMFVRTVKSRVVATRTHVPLQSFVDKSHMCVPRNLCPLSNLHNETPSIDLSPALPLNGHCPITVTM